MIETGGGWTRGSQVQVESICRTSSLYVKLITKPEFYQYNSFLDGIGSDCIFFEVLKCLVNGKRF
jgi:hypothetical protein